MDQEIQQVPSRHPYPGSREHDRGRIFELKKLETPSEYDGESEDSGGAVDLHTITLAGIERGLTLQDIKMMRLGQVVDFCISYNERNKVEEVNQGNNGAKKRGRRIATQEDIDAYLG